MCLTSLLRLSPKSKVSAFCCQVGIAGLTAILLTTNAVAQPKDPVLSDQLAATGAITTAEERDAGTRRFVDTRGLVRTERPEDQLVILEVRIGSMALDGEFIFGFQREDGSVLVGLGGLSDLLAFAIQVDPDTGIAEGWFLSEERTFNLSIGANSVAISGEQMPYPSDQIELHGDDIYATAETIQSWFPLNVSADLMRMALFVEPQEPLPFQQAQDRQALANQLSRASTGSFSNDQGLQIPYQMFAAPVFNVTASGSISRTESESASFGNLSLQSQGDLLGFSSSLNALVTYRDEGGLDLDTFDVLLEREDPSGSMLGSLNATNIAFGDVLMPSVPLISTVRRGRGAFISNTGSNRVSQANDFVLVGNVPPDWDVELYQDDRLLSIQTVGNDGRYEFSTLSLRPGANVFRIVAYGPNGEVDERSERVFLGPGLQSAGVLAYEVGAVQSSDALISLDNQSASDEPGLVARFEYGLSDTFSLVAGGAFGAIGRRTGEGALFAGARASLGGVYGAIDASMEEQGSFALSQEIRTSLNGLDVFATHLQNFNPPRDETTIQSETVVGVGHRPVKLLGLGVGQRVELKRQNRFNRPTSYIADHQFALNWRRWNANHSLNVQWFSGETQPTSIGGAVAIRGRQGNVLYRLQADYSPTQDKTLQNVSVQARRRFGRDTTATLDIDRDFNTGTTLFSLDLSWQFRKFSLGVTPSIDSKGNYVFSLALRTALLPQERALKYRFAGASEKSGATILGVRVFADLDADGQFDDNEPVLPDVIVSGTRKRSEGMTNAAGVAWVPNLMPGPQTIVSLDQRTLPDVTYRPAVGHLVVHTRPGVLPVIDYPILVMGEIDGFVVLDQVDENGEAMTVAGARVQLIDAQGVVVAQARTEYDGYYFFSELPLGDYSVQLSSIDSRQENRRYPAVLTAQEPYRSDVNLKADPS